MAASLLQGFAAHGAAVELPDALLKTRAGFLGLAAGGPGEFGWFCGRFSFFVWGVRCLVGGVGHYGVC